MARLLLLTLLLFPPLSCKKGVSENCNTDDDCAAQLRCAGHRCRRYIDCDLLATKYRACIQDIVTVRDSSQKPTEAQIQAALHHFENVLLKKSREERCTYDKGGIETCLKIKACPKFALCLLNLEKRDTP